MPAQSVSTPLPSTSTPHPVWQRKPLPKGSKVNLRFIDWIWHIRGSVTLAPGQSADEAFDRLDPLFRVRNTSHDRAGEALTFRKKDQDAQDRMSIFDAGELRVEYGPAGPVMRYALVSRALLFCFLAPLFFLAIAQATILLGKYQKPAAEAAAKAGDAKKKDAALPPMNPIDKALGAPAPEKPKEGEGGGRRNRKPSPTPAYVFAGIFAALYVGGRILEAWLIKRLFRRSLTAAAAASPAAGQYADDAGQGFAS